MTDSHDPSACPICLALRAATDAVNVALRAVDPQPLYLALLAEEVAADAWVAHIAAAGTYAVAEIDRAEIGSRACQGPDYSINHGGADLVGILTGAVACFLMVALLFLVAGSTGPITHAQTISTDTAPPAASIEAPPTLPADEAPPAGVTAPTVHHKAAQAPSTAELAPAETITADPAVQLACDVYSPGSDGGNGTAVAGWYRGVIPADIAARTPDSIRNCAPVVVP